MMLSGVDSSIVNEPTLVLYTTNVINKKESLHVFPHFFFFFFFFGGGGGEGGYNLKKKLVLFKIKMCLNSNILRRAKMLLTLC